MAAGGLQERPFVRLLSPNRRRLPMLHREDDRATISCLLTAGWTPYDGPAATDKKGWVLPGSDPAVKPKPGAPRVF